MGGTDVDSKGGGIPQLGEWQVHLVVVPVKGTGDRPASSYLRRLPLFTAQKPAVLPLPSSLSQAAPSDPPVPLRLPQSLALLLAPVSQAISHLPMLCAFPSVP